MTKKREYALYKQLKRQRGNSREDNKRLMRN